MAYFLLDIYTEKILKKNMALKDFLGKAPEKDYVDAFMKAKRIRNIDIIICAMAIAAMRTKYQSLYYASVKDNRYWMLDDVINRLSNELFAK